MDGIDAIFWLVIAITWMVSALILQRKRGVEARREDKEEGITIEERVKPDEVSGEEAAGEVREILVTDVLAERATIRQAKPEKEAPTRIEEPDGGPLEGTGERVTVRLDRETLREWVLVTEILLPPRAFRPYERVW